MQMSGSAEHVPARRQAALMQKSEKKSMFALQR
jgi:hypothetical protein